MELEWENIFHVFVVQAYVFNKHKETCMCRDCVVWCSKGWIIPIQRTESNTCIGIISRDLYISLFIFLLVLLRHFYNREQAGRKNEKKERWDEHRSTMPGQNRNTYNFTTTTANNNKSEWPLIYYYIYMTTTNKT